MTDTIDIHPHVISDDPDRYPLAPVGGQQSEWSKAHPATIEQLINEMDAAGIRRAAVVQASTAYGHDNSYLADSINRHPDRLTGVGSIDVLAEDAVAVLDGWLARGITGLRLFTSGSTMPTQANWLDDPRSFPVWEFAAERGIPICLQMRSEGLQLARPLFERFPATKVIIDHLAKPTLDDGPPYAGAANLFGVAQYENVFLKLTHRSLEAAQQGAATLESFIDALVSAFGARRIAWGSNFPAAGGTLAALHERARSSLAHLPVEDQEWIFRRTAESLYPALVNTSAEVTR